MFSNNLFQKDYQSYLNHIWGDAELGGGAEGGGRGGKYPNLSHFLEFLWFSTKYQVVQWSFFSNQLFQ